MDTERQRGRGQKSREFFSLFLNLKHDVDPLTATGKALLLWLNNINKSGVLLPSLTQNSFNNFEKKSSSIGVNVSLSPCVSPGDLSRMYPAFHPTIPGSINNHCTRQVVLISYSYNNIFLHISPYTTI